MNEWKEEKIQIICDEVSEIFMRKKISLVDAMFILINIISANVVDKEINDQDISVLENIILEHFKKAVKYHRSKTT